MVSITSVSTAVVSIASESFNSDSFLLTCSLTLFFLSEKNTLTKPFLEPGMAPLTNNKLRSLSTLRTSRHSSVTCMLPIWPAIFLPLNTRPGVWHCPVDPRARCESELPCVASCILKLWRFTPPWNPLPLDWPVTLTKWPAPKKDTSIVDRSESSASSTLISHKPKPISWDALA